MDVLTPYVPTEIIMDRDTEVFDPAEFNVIDSGERKTKAGEGDPDKTEPALVRHMTIIAKSEIPKKVPVASAEYLSIAPIFVSLR